MDLDSTALGIGALLGGKYRIERVLGRGGMGAVYLAENVDIGRKVAIKVLLPELTRDPEVLVRFRNEARAASAIRHPGIVEMIDLGKGPSGEAFLVMEALEGESLGALLRRVGRLDLPTTAWIVGEVLEAIGAAHAKGIVHRDLKPDNVFLVDQPRPAVKVLDFGISKFHVDSEPALTRTATVMGTPAYMAPEQARSARDAGPASDLYAIGAILYESLAGMPPFEGQSYNEIIARVMTEPHRPLLDVQPNVPGAVVAVVDSLLAKNPAARPATAAQALERLRWAMARPAEAAHPVAIAATFRREADATAPGPALRKRSWLVPALVFLATAALGVGLGFALWTPPAPPVSVAAPVVAAAQAPPDAEAPPPPAADASETADAAATGPDASTVAGPRDAGPSSSSRRQTEPSRPPAPAKKHAPEPKVDPKSTTWASPPAQPEPPEADGVAEDFGKNPYNP
ncbi:MAG: serine/threonine-protein kinase [Myxococcales bacterium]